MLIDPYQFQPMRIKRIVKEAPRAVSVQLERPASYTFAPGQHAVVRVALPDGSRLVRQYSFSAPESANELWLTIVQEPSGQVSSWFVETAKVEDTVEISPPFTGPLVQNMPRGEICMIAGGSGIAPLMTWVQTLRTKQRPFTLLYSTRSDERCFKNQLTPLPGETITIRLTDTEPRFTADELRANLSPETTVFICGSRPFVITMRNICEKVVQPERIYNEAFTL